MPVELEKMCRTCLAVDTAMLSIFDSHKSGAKDEKSSSLAAMLNTFTTAAISESDGLPKQVCLPCISEINRVFLFKIKCDNSQNTLKKYLEKVNATNSNAESDDDVIIVQDVNVKTDCDAEILLFEAPIDVKEKENDLNRNGEEGIIQENEIMVSDERSLDGGDTQPYENTQQYNEQFANSNKNNQITPESQEKDSLKCPLCLTSFTEKRGFLRHVLGRHSSDLPVALVEAILCNMNDEENPNNQQQPETEFAGENYTQLVSVNYEVEPDEFTDITEYDREDQFQFDEIPEDDTSQRDVFSCYVCSLKFETNHECDAHIEQCREEHQKGQFAFTSMECRIEIDSGALDKDEEDKSEDDKIEPDNGTKVDKPNVTNDNVNEDLNVVRTRSATVLNSPSSFLVKLNKNLRKKLECNICKKIFISEKSLASHMRSHDPIINESPRRRNEQHAEMKENVEGKNKDLPRHKCPVCKKGFQKLYSLKCHILTHVAKDPLACPVCGKCLSSRRNRNNHILLHTTLCYKCSLCRKAFITEKELNLHSVEHAAHKPPYVCNTCGCPFTNRKVLAKHNQIHKSDKPHICKFCSMRFKSIANLNDHYMQSHPDERAYRCQYCNRGFTRSSNCKKHIKTHTKRRSNLCPLCGLSFPEPGSMIKHYELHHPDEVHVLSQNGSEHT